MTYAPLEFSHRTMQVYERECAPVRKEFNLSQTAFDILLFLANNPEYHTARDIVEVRRLKANLVSVNVDRLVNEGYLIRDKIPGDRRKVKLTLTEKADPVIRKGRDFQKDFFRALSEGISEADLEKLSEITLQIEKNLNALSDRPDSTEYTNAQERK